MHLAVLLGLDKGAMSRYILLSNETSCHTSIISDPGSARNTCTPRQLSGLKIAPSAALKEVKGPMH
jgi:hypothetical protein